MHFLAWTVKTPINCTSTELDVPAWKQPAADNTEIAKRDSVLTCPLLGCIRPNQRRIVLGKHRRRGCRKAIEDSRPWRRRWGRDTIEFLDTKRAEYRVAPVLVEAGWWTMRQTFYTPPKTLAVQRSEMLDRPTCRCGGLRSQNSPATKWCGVGIWFAPVHRPSLGHSWQLHERAPRKKGAGCETAQTLV